MGLLLVNHPQPFILLSSLHLRHLEIQIFLALYRTVTLKPLQVLPSAWDLVIQPRVVNEWPSVKHPCRASSLATKTGMWRDERDHSPVGKLCISYFMNPKVQSFPPYLNVAKIGMCPTIVAGQVVVMTHDVVAYTHHSLQNKCSGEEENSKVSSQAFLRMLLMSPVLLLA